MAYKTIDDLAESIFYNRPHMLDATKESDEILMAALVKTTADYIKRKNIPHKQVFRETSYKLFFLAKECLSRGLIHAMPLTEQEVLTV